MCQKIYLRIRMHVETMPINKMIIISIILWSINVSIIEIFERGELKSVFKLLGEHRNGYAIRHLTTVNANASFHFRQH